MAVIVSVKFHPKRSNHLREKCNYRFFHTFVVTMETAAILETFNTAITSVQGGYRFCEVSTQKLRRSAKQKIQISFVIFPPFSCLHGNNRQQFFFIKRKASFQGVILPSFVKFRPAVFFTELTLWFSTFHWFPWKRQPF